jgi:hypothetical protein
LGSQHDPPSRGLSRKGSSQSRYSAADNQHVGIDYFFVHRWMLQYLSNNRGLYFRLASRACWTTADDPSDFVDRNHGTGFKKTPS